MKSKSLSYYIGTILIILSFIGFTITFYPVISIYLFPPPPQTIIKDNYFAIWIPKIKAAGKVIENVNPWDQIEYTRALKKGIAHAKGTALPNQKGSTFLFAHSTGLPWEITHYNTIFLRLGELRNGDEIKVYYKGKEYQYLVSNKKEVWPNELNYLLDQKNDQLVLQTCTPIGTSLKRLLVFAKRTTEQ